MNNGWFGVDLDGTLAEHYWPEKGDYDHTRIGDPVPDMVATVKGWLAAGKNVRIFTARVGPHEFPGPCMRPRRHEEGHDVSVNHGFSGLGYCEACGQKTKATEAREAIEAWCMEHLGVVLPVTATKDYGMILLFDDRCRQVIADTGIWVDMSETLRPTADLGLPLVERLREYVKDAPTGFNRVWVPAYEIQAAIDALETK